MSSLSIVGCASSAKLPIVSVSGPTPTLPAPKRARIPTVNVAKVVGWSGADHPVAAQGTIVNAFARKLDHPRWLYVLPNGDVLVAESNAPERPEMRTGIRNWFLRLFMHEGGAGEPSANRITLLRDADGDGIAEMRSTFMKNLNSPFGMALVGNRLYVANTDAVISVPYTTGQIEITSSASRVASLPAGPINHHWTRGLVANRDGSKLYVSVGSNSDYGERGLDKEVNRAAILEIDTKSGSSRVFASGMRNPVGLAWVPETNALWTAVNEREELGGDLPPDYMTAVKDGGFYGWPYTYHGGNPDPRVEQNPERTAGVLTPDYALGPHTSSMGLAYARNTNLPARFNNGMIVTQHGSWNRVPHSGYRVVFVPFSNGKPAGPPTVLLTAFLNDDNQAQGRPVGVAIDNRGSVLIADDAGNTIWRVSGTNPARTIAAATLSAIERFKTKVPANCVDANESPNDMAGDFAVAGFTMYASTWQQRQGNLLWKPAKSEPGQPLVIRAEPLEATGGAAEYRGTLNPANGAYSVKMQLPSKGTWLLRAEAGKSTGCFLYTLR